MELARVATPRGSKRKAAELGEEPMDEDITVTCIDIDVPAADLADPISSHPPRALVSKRIHLAVVGETKPITFVPPAVKAMLSCQACTSSSASPRVLILNDSFHKMLDYKAKHNKFPSTFDDMVSFLSEVHSKINTHSIHVVCPNSRIYSILNALVFLKQRLEHLGNSSSQARYRIRLQ